MEKEKFIELCKTVKQGYLPDRYPYEDFKGDSFYIKYEVGGMSGGSCWGGIATSYTCNERPEGFPPLDDFLLRNFPDINFLLYNKIKQHIKKTSEDFYPDYYGNGTDYVTDYIKFEDVWEVLNEFHFKE